MRQILNTLYVMTPHSYLHLENDTLRVDVEREKKMQVPLHHLGSVVCLGNIMLSPALMHRCADDDISVVLLDDNGRFKARLEGAVSGNILLRQAQHRQAGDVAFALNVSRAMIAGKLRNARQVLLRGAREAADGTDAKTLTAAATALRASVRNLPLAANLDSVRGIEGDAAKVYFSALNSVVRRDKRQYFGMDRRTRRPPRDRMNALLSFLYSMLMNDCRSALEAVGLDPQLGFLHAVRPGRAALALDLMEEFRAIVADRLMLTLINRGQIGKSDFVEREGGAVLLEGDARRAVVIAYQERKQEEITHPLLDTKMPIGLLPQVQARLLDLAIRTSATFFHIGLLPQVQARLLARHIRGESEMYIPFLVR